MRVLLLLLMMVLGLTGCGQRGLTPDDLPTRIPSVEEFATAEHLTAIAPPPGMRQAVSFPVLDREMIFVPNWRAEARVTFSGVFAGTEQTASAEANVRMWYNRVGNRRRIIVDAQGNLFGEEPLPTREGVRLGGESYLLIDGACLTGADGEAETLNELLIGDLLGGVSGAAPAGETAIIHGQEVWRYDFLVNDMTLPMIGAQDTGAITAMEGELWVADVPPGQPAVVRYYVNLAVDNVVLNLFQASQPVSGTLLLRYDLYDVGVDPNITRPNGC